MFNQIENRELQVILKPLLTDKSNGDLQIRE